jgi:hypothetical protein
MALHPIEKRKTEEILGVPNWVYRFAKKKWRLKYDAVQKNNTS